jgi:4-hydroxymandelate synthase
MYVEDIDHLEFYVEDASQAAQQLCEGFGFAICGEDGPRTGLAGAHSLLLRQHGITILVTSPLHDSHPAADYIRRHGDGLAVIAVRVADVPGAFAEAAARGAQTVVRPTFLGSGRDQVVLASVIGFGDVTHRLVQRERTGGPFLPGAIEEVPGAAPGGLLGTVDHIAVCVPAGELGLTVQRYQTIFGFSETFEERILVGSQAMDSKVVQNPLGTVTLTLLEPDTTRDAGQIDEFIEAHGGAGVQHVAFRTADITAAVAEVSRRGVPFLSTPASYYDVLTDRLGELDVPVATLRELSVLADRDRWGLLLQIFTRSQHPRRTLFYELIERRGARSFGSNNIKALYEAVERQRAAEQALRA